MTTIATVGMILGYLVMVVLSALFYLWTGAPGRAAAVCAWVWPLSLPISLAVWFVVLLHVVAVHPLFEKDS